MTTTTFEGWPKDTYRFLSEIEKNNNKPWFTENKPRFAEINSASKAFVETLADRLGSEGKAKVWRIYNDQRFSKGDPYKTSHDMGVLSDNGWLDGLRIDANAITVAAGSFGYDKEQLVRYREAVSDSETAASLIAALAEATAAGFGIDEPELKRPLKGLADDHPDPDLTRRKGLFITKTHSKKPKWVFSAEALDRVIDDLGSVPLFRAWVNDNVL